MDEPASCFHALIPSHHSPHSAAWATPVNLNPPDSPTPLNNMLGPVAVLYVVIVAIRTQSHQTAIYNLRASKSPAHISKLHKIRRSADIGGFEIVNYSVRSLSRLLFLLFLQYRWWLFLQKSQFTSNQ